MQTNKDTPILIFISYFILFFFSGESAFTSLVAGYGWAKNPMINRIQHLDERVPITFIYGQNTWMDKSIGMMVKNERINSHVHVEVNLLYFVLYLL